MLSQVEYLAGSRGKHEVVALFKGAAHRDFTCSPGMDLAMVQNLMVLKLTIESMLEE